MPNWVRQRVIAKDMQLLKQHLVNKEGKVDFNMVVPMPKDLEITSGSFSYEIPSRFFQESTNERLKKQQPVEDALKQAYDSNKTQEEFVQEVLKDTMLVAKIKTLREWSTVKTENNPYPMSEDSIKEALTTFIKGFYNIQKHGFRDWYEWSISNWGTKWNASDYSQFVGDDIIEFETAWSMAHPIYAALAKYTPIRVVYADEDIGSNCGMVDFFTDEEGDVSMSEVMGESRELACDTWGYGTMDVYDKDWNEIEDENDERYIQAQKEYNQVQEEIRELMTVDCLINDYEEVV